MMQSGSGTAKEAARRFGKRCVLLLALFQAGLGAGRADELDCWNWRNPRPHNQQIFALIRGGGLWLCFSQNGLVTTSLDGVDWAVTSVGTNAAVAAAAYGNGVIIASVPTRGLYLSADAHHWSRAPANPGVTALVFGAGRFATHGANWTERPAPELFAATELAWAEGLFVSALNQPASIHPHRTSRLACVIPALRS